MKNKIKDFAEIIPGYSFRGSIVEDPAGEYLVLQAKDISMGDYISDSASFTRIFSSNIRKPVLLKTNDIVITSRGRGPGSFKAAIFKSAIASVIPSSSLIVIRLKNNLLVPEFVVSYLNSNQGQSVILKSVTGGVFQTLLRKDLAEIEIPVPSTDKQKLISDLSHNIFLQEYLSKRLASVRSGLLNGIIESMRN